MTDEEYTPPPQMADETRVSTDRERLWFLIDSQENKEYREAMTAALDESGRAGEVSTVEYREIIMQCIDVAIVTTGYAIAEGTLQ